ncbi:hypothetical protein Cylst_2294 [Cylindrospermum stagnale PCC 7417]|uniref:Uncharacterized protein n=1 Tax=Cylindrospermum stagnale PCC 7417 TaxID=56107 RepID=K9WXI4_9NOST|nr:hypothetical protein [Cylindrospermum stagnale]AFZ24524.1 hypothetical protein Cylst_2294 [Cylindrospermum stagnale PCC 7417]
MEEKLIIVIEYKMLNQPTCEKIEITPDEYFEPMDEDEYLDSLNEEYDFDSVPKYFHAVDYIGCKLCEVEHTKLTIVDRTKDIKHICSETFWNGGDNRTILTQILGLGKPSYELLVETVINKIPKTIQQIKFIVEDDIAKFQNQLIIQCNEDGSETILVDA